jgi:hypothetical protein
MQMKVAGIPEQGRLGWSDDEVPAASPGKSAVFSGKQWSPSGSSGVAGYHSDKNAFAGS